MVDTVSGMAGSDIGRFAFRCARLDVVNMDGLWHIVRGTTAMSSTFGTGAGSAFGWTVENDATTGFPGALFGYDLTFAVPGTVHSLRASGAAPYLRVP